MGPSDLLDFALGLADDAPRAQIEREAAIDPLLARRLARLISNLDALLDDGRTWGVQDRERDTPAEHDPRAK
jgi:hypothetical protein